MSVPGLCRFIPTKVGIPERHIPARKQQTLSAAKVKTLKTPGTCADGKGLNLKVEDTGAKRRNIGLRGYPSSLAEAREVADANSP